MATRARRLGALLAIVGVVACTSAAAQPAAGAASAAAANGARTAAPGASAAAPAARAPLPPRGTYSEKGADTCLECHDDVTPGYSGAAIFKGKHAHRRDARAPFGPGGLQCEACHGPGARHAAKGSKKALTINSFKADSFLSVEQRNQ